MTRLLYNRRQGVTAVCARCGYQDIVVPFVGRTVSLDMARRRRETNSPQVWICSDCMEMIL